MPYGDFSGCLQTEETNALEPEVLEYKFYAPGVGFVHAIDTESGQGEALVEVFGLEGPEELEEAFVRVVYSATDDDAQTEIVVDAGAGLERVQIYGPEGDLVLQLDCLSEDDLGQTKIQLETPEPSL